MPTEMVPIIKKGWPWDEEVQSTAYDSSLPWPTISIVVPSYNQAQYLEETLRSIIFQHYPRLELIVMDGGSKDHSVEIIQKYAPWITAWVSEKDRGQSHAINKGIALAKGDIFNWINSDDYLTKGALLEIATLYMQHQPDIIAGNVQDFSESGLQKLHVNTGFEARLMARKDRSFHYHQPGGMWLRLDQLKALGGIDEASHYSFDWDLLFRYLHQFPKVQYTNKTLAFFRLHDNSKTVTGRTSTFLWDRLNIIKRLLDNPYYQDLHPALRRHARIILVKENLKKYLGINWLVKKLGIPEDQIKII